MFSHKKIVLIFIVFLGFHSWLYAADDLFLGILEQEPQLTIEDEQSIKGPKFAIRLCFQRTDDKWVSVDQGSKHIPRKLHWFIAFDGKMIGQVDTIKRSLYKFISEEGEQDLLTRKEQIPKVGVPTKEFEGDLGSTLYRPLIAITQERTSDPDRWKPFVPSAKTIEQILEILPQVVKKNKNLYSCNSSGDHVQRKVQFSKTEIEVKKSYRSKDGLKLISIAFKLSAGICNQMAEFDASKYWFIDKNDHIEFLVAGYKLVDTGDYQGNGHSDVIFMDERHNRWGYRLYFDDFKKFSEFSGSYH